MMSLSKHKLLSSVAAVVLLFNAHLVAAGDSDAAQDRKEVDADTATVLSEFRAMKGAEAAFDKAAGYAVFNVTKAGFVASGAGGGGVAVDKKTGARTYMRMGSAGLGLTLGVSRYGVVILFETSEKFAAFANGGWDSSATAQAAAGSKGAEISSTFFDGVAYYQVDKKGLMASADVSGTKFWVADALTGK
ncbi:MAG: YSC84-related protein [Gammaproteobacteria bacterium]